VLKKESSEELSEVLRTQDAIDYIESELLSVVDVINTDKGPGRMTQSAVYGFLARLNLNAAVYRDPYGTPDFTQADMDQVISYTNSIINSGDFSLSPEYFELFNDENNSNPELIFALDQRGVLTREHSRWAYWSIAGAMFPRPEWPSADGTDGPAITTDFYQTWVDANGDVTFDFDANRGAEDETEFALQEARIVEAIVGLNADVVGLMEIENDGFGDDSAIVSLVAAVNAELADTEQYSFISTADSTAIGTDAITVGLLYRATIVTPEGDAQVVDMPIQQIDEDSVAQMRPSLIQSFAHVESGKTFAVAVNHFKSKGSQCGEDIAEEVSETDTIQGSCNALRVSAAITLGEALSDDSLPERILVLGDLNSYSAEDPVAVLTDYTAETQGYTVMTAANTGMDDGASVEVTANYGYVNLAEEFDAEGYSYWFYGTEKVGSLDHVLASEAMLADAVDGAHWSINSPEVYQFQYDQALTYYADEDGYAFTDVGPFRSSDHDPFIATFNLEAELPDEADPVEDDNDSGGSMGFILALMAGVLTFRRRSAK